MAWSLADLFNPSQGQTPWVDQGNEQVDAQAAREAAARTTANAAVSPRNPGSITHTLNSIGSIPWFYATIIRDMMQRANGKDPN